MAAFGLAGLFFAFLGEAAFFSAGLATAGGAAAAAAAFLAGDFFFGLVFLAGFVAADSFAGSLKLPLAPWLLLEAWTSSFLFNILRRATLTWLAAFSSTL